jgi:preprotein translocase subunit SecA
MGKLHGFLGLSVGVVVNQQNDAEKQAAYRRDITYGQNNEFGFDYLRDNMKFSALEYQQRPLNYAIVDEVDSILIDEARTPLIISGQGERSSDKYRVINEIIPRCKQRGALHRRREGPLGHADRRGRRGRARSCSAAARLKGAPLRPGEPRDAAHPQPVPARAHALQARRQLHGPRGQEVMIIDEFTGRVLAGRRWSDGLHQAVEAKENVRIQEESRTMATITFQNLFRIYKKLAGMTGTADTEAAEFHSDVQARRRRIIPTNKDNIREDFEDVVYKTEKEKFTRSSPRSSRSTRRAAHPRRHDERREEPALAKLLEKKGIKHAVLNAKHHENEAYVVAQAGRKGAITVSTNMAGRGTDILLGGNPEMLAKLRVQGAEPHPRGRARGVRGADEELRVECKAEGDEVREIGGLYILGTERHESRRIDNQLRGRAGRQGDPGTPFFLSLEDDLMRIFAGDRVKNLMERMGMPDDEPIEHPWVTKSVENAQKKVEERNFDIRKNLLEYDDVMNAQRKTSTTAPAAARGPLLPRGARRRGQAHRREARDQASRPTQETVLPEVGALLGMFAEIR